MLRRQSRCSGLNFPEFDRFVSRRDNVCVDKLPLPGSARRHAAEDLHLRQTRSPAHSLGNRDPHIRHFLVLACLLRWLSGFASSSRSWVFGVLESSIVIWRALHWWHVVSWSSRDYLRRWIWRCWPGLLARSSLWRKTTRPFSRS